ncbi:hypothetical protein YC2023_037697 [Brassica napus]
MLRDILLWALRNPVHYQETESLPGFFRLWFQVLLTVPDETEYVGSVWMYPNLARSLTESPIRTRSKKLPTKIKLACHSSILFLVGYFRLRFWVVGEDSVGSDCENSGENDGDNGGEITGGENDENDELERIDGNRLRNRL